MKQPALACIAGALLLLVGGCQSQSCHRLTDADTLSEYVGRCVEVAGAIDRGNRGLSCASGNR
jgi:hypothetical protein